MSQQTCPSTLDLRRLLRGELPEAQAAPLERHFATCPHCARLAAALEAEDEPVRSPPSDWPRREVVERLIDQLEVLSVADDRQDTCLAASPGGPPPPLSFQTEFPGATAESVPLPEVPGYEILAELNRGGRGVVYRARQTGLNRIVALKMILSGEHAGAEQRARFQIEAEAAARLRHPNIVQVFEVGQASGRAFLSMEFCPDGSLADLIREGPLAPERAAHLLEQVATAVQVAHQGQVIHRDFEWAARWQQLQKTGKRLLPDPATQP